MNAEQWVETPMYLLREDCLLRQVGDWPRGSFLEIGAGTGRLTREFLDRGFNGTCYDLGDDNRDILRRNLNDYGDQVRVVDAIAGLPSASFDYVFAFEVLEHIEDDADALTQWTRFLKPGGRLLLSVPAHMAKFSAEDRAVGHIRRYEKDELSGLIENAGFTDVDIKAYGFPLAIVTRRGNQWLSRRRGDDRQSDEDAEALSIRSGVERTPASVRVARILNRRTITPFLWMQRAFFDRDLGDGYIATATKTEAV